MKELIKADIYKETKKKSFKLIIFLIPMVVLFSLIIIKNNLQKETYENKLDEISYYEINKKGNYNKYSNSYEKYKEKENLINEINSTEKESKARDLIVNATPIYYIIGFFIIYIVFNNFSYDLNYKTLKYVFLSGNSKAKIYLSKIIGITIISILLLLYSSTLVLILSHLLTKLSPLLITKMIYINNSFIKVPLVIYSLLLSLKFLIPIIFIMILTSLLSLLFKGNTFGLIISILIYIFSSSVLNICLIHNLSFIKYTFIPYIDYTYFSGISYLYVNAIYNTNITEKLGFIVLAIYSLIFARLSINLYKKDL